MSLHAHYNAAFTGFIHPARHVNRTVPSSSPDCRLSEDCDSIYNKSTWGGVIIDQRGLKEGRWVDGVIIRDFRIENPGRNKPVVKMTLPEHPCSFRNVLLKNITALRDNGHPFRVTGGGPNSIIENVTFEDIKLGDRWIEDFSPNNFTLAFVKNLKIVRDGKTVATYSSDIEADAKQLRPDPTNLLRNPGFEISGIGWSGQQVNAATVQPHEGRFAYRSSDEFNSINLVKQDVTEEVKKRGGGRFRVIAWMRIESGEGTGTVSLHYGQINRATGARDVGSVALEPTSLRPGEWVQVVGELALPGDREKYDWLRWVQFQVLGKGKFEDLYFDNCGLKYIGGQDMGEKS